MKVVDLRNSNMIGLESEVIIADHITCDILFEGTFMKGAKQFKNREVKQISAMNDKLLLFVSQIDK